MHVTITDRERKGKHKNPVTHFSEEVRCTAWKHTGLNSNILCVGFDQNRSIVTGASNWYVYKIYCIRREHIQDLLIFPTTNVETYNNTSCLEIYIPTYVAIK